jgi:hypothetical protein
MRGVKSGTLFLLFVQIIVNSIEGKEVGISSISFPVFVRFIFLALVCIASTRQQGQTWTTHHCTKNLARSGWKQLA